MTVSEKLIFAAVFANRYEETLHPPSFRQSKNYDADRAAWYKTTIANAIAYATCAVYDLRDAREDLVERESSYIKEYDEFRSSYIDLYDECCQGPDHGDKK